MKSAKGRFGFWFLLLFEGSEFFSLLLASASEMCLGKACIADNVTRIFTSSGNHSAYFRFTQMSSSLFKTF